MRCHFSLELLHLKNITQMWWRKKKLHIIWFALKNKWRKEVEINSTIPVEEKSVSAPEIIFMVAQFLFYGSQSPFGNIWAKGGCCVDSTAEVGAWKPITTQETEHTLQESATQTYCFQTNCNIYQEVAFEHRAVQKYREAKESLGPRELFCSKLKRSEILLESRRDIYHLKISTCLLHSKPAVSFYSHL